MSDTPLLHPSTATSQPARPVSLFTIVFLLAVFAAFLLVIRWFYQPSDTAAFNARADNYPSKKQAEEVQWRATSESRRQSLTALQAEEAKKTASYAWVDQQAGVVQLPIERAMELTAQKYGAKK